MKLNKMIILLTSTLSAQAVTPVQFMKPVPLYSNQMKVVHFKNMESIILKEFNPILDKECKTFMTYVKKYFNDSIGSQDDAEDVYSVARLIEKHGTILNHAFDKILYRYFHNDSLFEQYVHSEFYRMDFREHLENMVDELYGEYEDDEENWR